MEWKGERFLELSKLDQRTREEYRELCHYFVLIEHEVYWNNRNKYLKIIDDCLKSRIDIDEFITEFYALRRETAKYSRLLKSYLLENQGNLKLTFKSTGFVRILDNLFYITDLYDPDWIGFELNNDLVSREGFMHYLEVVCWPEISNYIEKQGSYSSLPIQDYQNWFSETNYQVDTKIYKDSEVLRSIMAFFIIVSWIAYSILNSYLFNIVWQ